MQYCLSLVLATLAALLAACGSSNNGNGSGGCTGVPSATIVISSSGLSANSLCLVVGGTLTFNNQDTVAHDIESGATCPDLNLGVIAPAASATATLGAAQTCTFEDASNPAITAFHGTVTVSTGSGGGGGGGGTGGGSGY